MKKPEKVKYKGSLGPFKPIFRLSGDALGPFYFFSQNGFVRKIPAFIVESLPELFEPIQDLEPKEYTESDMIAFAAAMREDWVRACDEINPWHLNKWKEENNT